MLALMEVELYTPQQTIPDAVVIIEGEKIVNCGPMAYVPVPNEAERLSLPGKKVFPGFIDVHIHGLLGRDMFGDGLAEAIQSLPRFGVTSFLATTVTLPTPEIMVRLKRMAEILTNPPTGATCLGIHLEGPHLSPKRPGMANPTWFHPLTLEEFEAFQEASGGNIRMITFAPEEGGSLSLIPYLLSHHVIPVIGHSDASYELVAEAVSLGLAHATHTFNAMPPFHHRTPGVIGAVMAFPQIIAQLIADGHHVHPGAMRALLNAKSPAGVCLVSDAAPFAALPEGEYRWEAYTLVIKDGKCYLPDGTLAGAHALMDDGFRNLINLVGLTPLEASICASQVPARALGLANRKGRIQPGFDADLIVMDESYRVRLTMIGGRIVWRTE